MIQHAIKSSEGIVYALKRTFDIKTVVKNMHYIYLQRKQRCYNSGIDSCGKFGLL